MNPSRPVFNWLVVWAWYAIILMCMNFAIHCLDCRIWSFCLPVVAVNSVNNNTLSYVFLFLFFSFNYLYLGCGVLPIHVVLAPLSWLRFSSKLSISYFIHVGGIWFHKIILTLNTRFGSR